VECKIKSFHRHLQARNPYRRKRAKVPGRVFRSPSLISNDIGDRDDRDTSRQARSTIAFFSRFGTQASRRDNALTGGLRRRALF
jgi:hypothetical protein